MKDMMEQAQSSEQKRVMRIAIQQELRVCAHWIPLPDACTMSSDHDRFIESYVKTLLWLYGGHTIYVDAPERIFNRIKQAFSLSGNRSFDVKFMSQIYQRPFDVIKSDDPMRFETNDQSSSIGRHMDGCRIGFDAGGSDRKVSAVMNGVVIYSEEVTWSPKTESDPNYHLEGIMSALSTAGSKLPRVDAVGISSAGIYIDDETRVASLFMSVGPSDVDKVRTIYRDAVRNTWGDVPFVVVNDGDVTALSGSIGLNRNNILGIAMGTSEAAGYINPKGSITGWLNELAFVPIDMNPEAVRDEWSNDIGCGVKYLSQDAVIRLSKRAGIDINDNLTAAQSLEYVQKLLREGNREAEEVFKTIGVYLGYAILYYHHFYGMDALLILGRVTSGLGGDLILSNAKAVLEHENPSLFNRLFITLPDEKSRRIGQSVAAASLPKIGGIK